MVCDCLCTHNDSRASVYNAIVQLVFKLKPTLKYDKYFATGNLKYKSDKHIIVGGWCYYVIMKIWNKNFEFTQWLRGEHIKYALLKILDKFYW